MLPAFVVAVIEDSGLYSVEDYMRPGRFLPNLVQFLSQQKVGAPKNKENGTEHAKIGEGTIVPTMPGGVLSHRYPPH